ncbi:LysR substrate-binding domain-containing protein, partial [Mesorhizobium amorphae]|uniref:LysR substrate-binding domain-containing protein n=1 Tax=Mesorhizobium amorphae TaxID=71433 RepID=UPI003F4FA6C8
DVRFEVDSLYMIINMVMEEKAYSILTPSAIQKEASQGLIRTVKIVDPVITRSVVLAVNPKDERSPAVSAVRKIIPKVVKTLIEGKRSHGSGPSLGMSVKPSPSAITLP